MPKYKPSPGMIEIKTPMGKEMVAWLKAELDNFAAWNPRYVSVKGRVYEFEGIWKITLTDISIKVSSKAPVVHLSHGIRFLMGSGRMEVC